MPHRRALIGLFLAVFAVLALSGPGRLDVVDGHTRYAVARSLVDYGDSVVRDPEAHFAVFPGRNGDRYAYYRFPHSGLGALALVAADLTGPVREERRHFFFVLSSAGAGATLAVLYFLWFCRHGVSTPTGMLWSLAGIFCTPAWHYATTTFDEIFGACAIVAALVVSERHKGSVVGCATSGLLLGLAFNLKPPLALFALPVAMLHAPNWRSREFRRSAAVVGIGLVLGVLAYVGYDLCKFPPGTKATHVIGGDQQSIWTGSPLVSLVMLILSPGASVFLFFPAIVLTLVGLSQAPKAIRQSHGLAAAGFTWFVCALAFFKGDLCWGPRYLTPVFGVLWLFAPAGAARMSRWVVGTLLGASLVVQLLSLAVDPYRLYIEQAVASHGVSYFAPAHSHVLNRPREIAEVWRARYEPTEAFTPSALTTFEFARLPPGVEGSDVIRRYRILNSFRPWWHTFRYVAEAQRPVNLDLAIALFAVLGIGGVGLLVPSVVSSSLSEDRS